MDCFLWKFSKTCLPFSSTLLTLFLQMSWCRFKKTGIHLTTYLKCLTTPSCTRSNSPPKVWYQNHTKPVCSLGLWKYLKFQILAIERIRSKQDHEAGSPGTMEGEQCSSDNKRAPQCGCMKLTSVMPWPRHLWRLPENVLHTPTQHVSHLFGYFPSWDVRECSELCVTLLFLFHGATMTPTGDFLLTKPRVLSAHTDKCRYWLTMHSGET